MLKVNPSPFPAIYDILKKWWYHGTKRLNKKYIPIAKKGKTGLANEYQPAFELVANDPDVVQFCATISAKTQSKKGYKSAPQTINQTIYKIKEDEERILLGRVSFVKKGIRLGSISQVDLQEMLQRGLITEEKYKNLYCFVIFELHFH
tara:strand:- start:631 stop:1074 length:444 start_codon:yes stop_codon:yes gene_type:complete